jgi:hypothetical protein
MEEFVLISGLSDERFTNYFRLHKDSLVISSLTRGDVLEVGCNAQKTIGSKNNVALHYIRQEDASPTMRSGAEQNQKLVPRTKLGKAAVQ